MSVWWVYFGGEVARSNSLRNVRRRIDCEMLGDTLLMLVDRAYAVHPAVLLN